ncbi:MAG: hypothetical protein R3195_01960 [Gemmatimonadota bacterium]|nr:hypothetical protein [Gemmatimonadota bacterium]
MEETYERELERTAAAVPDRGCLIALVATSSTDQAAALASDLAQLVGRARRGHTMLVSVEDAPPALDHEIGVEGGAGLTEVLEGAATAASVAAHGRARGFIYVPGGAAPRPASEVLRSPRFRRLSESATSRGGALLAFLALDALADAEGLPASGVVWLGGEPGPDVVRPPWPVLGTVLPPGPRPAGPQPPPSAVADAPSESGSPPSAYSMSPLKLSGPRTGPDPMKLRALRGPVVAVVLATLLATAAVTMLMVSRSRNDTSFLPENDALWFAPDTAGSSDTLDGIPR